MLERIEIKLNSHGCYDIFVDGEIMLEMLVEDEVAEGVQFLMTHSIEELKAY